MPGPSTNDVDGDAGSAAKPASVSAGGPKGVENRASPSAPVAVGGCRSTDIGYWVTRPPSAQNSARKAAAPPHPDSSFSATTTAFRQPRSRNANVPSPATCWEMSGAKRKRFGAVSPSVTSRGPLVETTKVVSWYLRASSRRISPSPAQVPPITTSTWWSSISTRVCSMSVLYSPPSVQPATSSTGRPAIVVGVTPSLGSGPFSAAPRSSSGISAPASPASRRLRKNPTHSASTPTRTGVDAGAVHPCKVVISSVTETVSAAPRPCKRRDRLLDIGCHPHSGLIDGQFVRGPTDVDGFHHLTAGGIEAGNGAVDRVGHPDRAGADGDTGRAATDRNGREDRVVGGIDRYHGVAQRVGDPDQALAHGDRPGWERQVDARLGLAGDGIQPPEPAVHGIAEHPHRARPDREFPELHAVGARGERAGERHQHPGDLGHRPAARAQPLDERATGYPDDGVL